MDLKKAMTALRKERKKISDSRDALRDVLDELETQEESCRMALEDLDSCIATLSEYV